MSLAFRHSVERDQHAGRHKAERMGYRMDGRDLAVDKSEVSSGGRRNEVAPHVTRVMPRGGPSSISHPAAVSLDVSYFSLISNHVGCSESIGAFLWTWADGVRAVRQSSRLASRWG